ncbi:MAG: HlyD family efflux transporter periplasmic adaptor subunit [Eubacterium sp.]|nr:HlyD family efflux transporter periplasmic adaptor subunit [Eubacterium sp.]
MKKKRIVVAVIVVAAIVAAVGIWASTRSAAPAATAVDTGALAKTNIQRTIDTSGTIESTSVEQVSNMTNIPVWDVDVELGNYVSRGDRLCRLYAEETDTWESVYATVDGTITEINAVNGAPANGVLFTIENTNSLKVVTRFKESDIGTVTTGMPVTITTDATGDREYQGTLLSIAPTAVKSSSTTAAQTAQSTTSSPEFEAVVSIDSPIDGLRIGMNADLKTVVEERADIYSVAYDALTKNAAGENCILVAADEKDGVYTVKEIKVDTGIESDFAVEIASPELTDGLPVITNVSAVKAGDQVTLTQDQGADNAQQ